MPRFSPLMYNTMKEALTEKANKLREDWKNADQENAFECGVKFADAQKALDLLEELYLEYATPF